MRVVGEGDLLLRLLREGEELLGDSEHLGLQVHRDTVVGEVEEADLVGDLAEAVDLGPVTGDELLQGDDGQGHGVLAGSTRLLCLERVGHAAAVRGILFRRPGGGGR